MLIRRTAYGHVCAFLGTLLLAGVVPAWSWGPVGHRIIAQIAEKRLHPQTRKRLELLAGEGTTLVSLANWADDIREERPETARWHYINIPPNATELDLDRDCPRADCITVKAREFLGIVRLGVKKQEERLDAMRFLIHLMGDLHQPLHVGFARDRGGNDIPIVFHGEESNLHKLWDSDLLGKHIRDEDIFTSQLLSEIRPQDEKQWSRGHIREWTWESRQLAMEAAYGGLPGEDPKTIDEAYSRRAWEVVKEQLAKGGIRLAVIMNEMWGY